MIYFGPYSDSTGDNVRWLLHCESTKLHYLLITNKLLLESRWILVLVTGIGLNARDHDIKI